MRQKVVSKTLLLKKTSFSEKKHCFPTCALFYPIVLEPKIITVHATRILFDYIILCVQDHVTIYVQVPNKSS